MTGASLGVSRQSSADKAPGAFRTIREVSEELGVPQHVLRFWESRFGQVKPLKRAGGRRYYRPEDVELLRRIQRLLYQDGYTIRGVQKLFRENGVRAMRAAASSAPSGAAPAPAAESRPTPAAAAPAVARPSAPKAPPAEAVASDDAPIGPELRARLEALAGELEAMLALLRG